MNNTWHDGPEWEGWDWNPAGNLVEKVIVDWEKNPWSVLICEGELSILDPQGGEFASIDFPTPTAALSVANAIIRAWGAEQAQGEPTGAVLDESQEGL